MNMTKSIIRFMAASTLFLTMAACESTDCPINNVVYSIYGFYTIVEGEEASISVLDTLTVTASGSDSVLINRMQNSSQVEIPVSYSAPTDTLIFHFTDTLQRTSRDTIWIDKDNFPHYDSPTCPASIFHYVKAVRCTNLLIDSVSIVNPNINYNVSENFKIYFRSSN